MISWGEDLPRGGLGRVIHSELSYIRRLGASHEMILTSSNLGAFEAVLIIAAEGRQGVPIYKAVDGVTSRFSSQSGIIKRLKLLREAGLIEEKSGEKRSQTYLSASEKLIGLLREAMLEKHYALQDYDHKRATK